MQRGDTKEIGQGEGKKSKSKECQKGAEQDPSQEPGQAGRAAVDRTRKAEREVREGRKYLGEPRDPVKHALSTKRKVRFTESYYMLALSNKE